MAMRIPLVNTCCRTDNSRNIENVGYDFSCAGITVETCTGVSGSLPGDRAEPVHAAD